MHDVEWQAVRAGGLADRLTNRCGFPVDSVEVIEALAELGLVLTIDPVVERAMRLAGELRTLPGPLTRDAVATAARRNAVPAAVLLDACALRGLEVVG